MRTDRACAEKYRREDTEDKVREQEIEDREERRDKDKVYQRVHTQETTHQGLNINKTADSEDRES